MRRRTLLCGFSGLITFGSGCFDQNDPIEVGLGHVEIENNLSESIQFRVQIERKDEVRYDQTSELGVQENNTMRIKEVWMGDKVNYRTLVTIDEADLEDSISTREVQQMIESFGGQSCYSVEFDISNKDKINMLLGVGDC